MEDVACFRNTMNRYHLSFLVFAGVSSGIAALVSCATSEKSGSSDFASTSSSGSSGSSSGTTPGKVTGTGSTSGSGGSSGGIIETQPSGGDDASEPLDGGQPDSGRPTRCDDAGCHCINIASIGAHGETGSSTGDNGNTQSFIDWLNTESSASVDTFTTKPTLTYDPTNQTDAAAPGELLLNNYDVIILQWLANVANPGPGAPAQGYWQFSADEVSALQAWVENGGGIVSMSGYEQMPTEIGPVNKLLSFTEIQYGSDDVLGNCQLFDGGTDNLCYCNQNAIPLGPPWANTAIGANITQVGAYHGRSVLTNGADAIVDIQDSTYKYAAHQTIGKGHVFVYADEWVTYSSQWLTVGGDAGGGVSYDDPSNPCFGRSSGAIFQVPQFWYNSISFAASAVACQFTIQQPAQLPPIVERPR